MKTIFSTLALVLVVNVSFAQVSDEDSTANKYGIIYGSDHAFGLLAPEGWVLDNQAGVSQGLHAVFYPSSGSWGNSPAVMYATTASTSVEDNETVEALITYDSTQFVQNHPGVKIFHLETLTTQDHKKATVKRFVYSQHEAIAYIQEKTIIAMIVLSARSDRDYRKALPAFRELVRSYRFLTTDVIIDGK